MLTVLAGATSVATLLAAVLSGTSKLRPTTPELAFASSWNVDDGDMPQAWSTYSIIVVALNPHPSNLFRDKDRVRAYSRGVISAKFANPRPGSELEADETGAGQGDAFYVGHDKRADRRVRVIHAADLIEKDGPPGANEVRVTPAQYRPQSSCLLSSTDGTHFGQTIAVDCAVFHLIPVIQRRTALTFSFAPDFLKQFFFCQL